MFSNLFFIILFSRYISRENVGKKTITKIIIKRSNGKTIKLTFEGFKELTNSKLIEIEIIRTKEFAKLSIKADLSLFFLAKKEIYSIIAP